MELSIVKFDSPELQVIEKSKAEQIKATFEPMAKMLSEFEAAYNEVLAASEKEITKELTQKAKRVRLDIGKVRIETGKLKDKQKEYLKLEDRAIMGVHNILVWAVKEKEDKLKSIEDFFEIQEQKRLEELQKTRAEKLLPYLPDAHERVLYSMEEDVFNAYYKTKVQEYNDRIEAEKKAEEERIAVEKRKKKHTEREYSVRGYGRFFDWDLSDESLSDEEWDALVVKAEKAKLNYEEEQAKTKTENERLQKEAEEKRTRDEKRNKELIPYIVFIRDYNKMLLLPDKEYKKEFSEIKKGAEDHWEFEKKEQIRLQAEAEAREKAIEAERKKREKLEAELKAKNEAEEAQRKAIEEERKAKELAAIKAAKAPDKEKLNKWVGELSMPELKLSTIQGISIAQDIDEEFNSFKNWAKKLIETI